MIRICCQCQTILGEVEPLEDRDLTHTYCDLCAEREETKIRAGAYNWIKGLAQEGNEL